MELDQNTVLVIGLIVIALIGVGSWTAIFLGVKLWKKNCRNDRS